MKVKEANAQHIVVVIASLGGGGAERVVADLCFYLQEAGRTVTLLTLTGEDADAYVLAEGIRRERMEIRRAANSWFDTVRFSFRRFKDIRRRILSLRPDVVVSFIEQTNVRVAASLIGTGIPVILSERTHPGRHHVSSAWRLTRRLLYRYADAVVVQTGTAADWLRKSTPTRRLVIIPNAVRALVDLGADQEEDEHLWAGPYVLAIGRLGKEKGFDLLIEAFARSALADEDWRLVVLGEGDERAALRKQAEECGVGGSLEMPGHVRGVGPWLRNADIFALSSRYEGFPNALVEALQLGCASISFDCESGPSDLIENEQNGLLAPEGDVEALAFGLRRLASDPDLRKRLSTAAAISTNARFDRTVVYGKWMELIDAVTSARTGPAGSFKDATAPAENR